MEFYAKQNVWRFRELICALMIAFVISLVSCGGDEDNIITEELPPDSLVIGAPAQVLTDGHDPSASPTGQWLAYEAGGGIIQKATILGDSVTIIADSAYDPDWSHHHDLIVYRSGDTLFVADPATNQPVWDVVADFDDNPAWSADGTKIAVQADQGILIVNYPVGSSSIVPCSYNGGACDGEHPSWAPDGTWIAFEQGLRILRVSPGGGDAETVVNTGSDVSGPAWSPDGRCIAFPMDGLVLGQTHIWLIDLAYGTLWKLTEGDYADHNPAWAPSSKTIYFDRSTTDSAMGIWRVNLDFIFSTE